MAPSPTGCPAFTPADRISLALRNSDDTLGVVAFNGGTVTFDTDRIPIIGTKLGDCLRSRKPVVVADADRPGEKYSYSLTPRKDQYRSTAILPLNVGDNCLGTLNFGNLAPNTFSSEIVKDLSQIAIWIALQISRYAAIDKLRASEARFDALIENAHSIIFAKSGDGRMLLANRRFCDAFGLDSADVIGHTDSEIFGTEAANRWREDDLRILKSGASETIEEPLSYPDGSVRPHITQKFSVWDPALGAKIICAISTDISEQKEVERALQESEERSNAFFDNSPYMMYIKDSEGRLTFANPEYLRFYGQSEKETLGKQTTRNVNLEKTAELKAVDDDVLENGTIRQFEIELPRGDGTNHNLLINKFPLHDADGTVVGIGGVNTDITEVYQQRKELQIARDEAEMVANMYREAADKAQIADSAKTDFVASMSHELRTPLNGALGMTTLLLDTKLDNEQLKMVETIRASSHSLLMILNDILDLAKVEANELHAANLDFSLPTFITGIEDMWKPQVNAKSLNWECRIDCTMAPVLLSDSSRIRQIIFNLVSNALKFTETGGISLSVTQKAVNHGLIETIFEISDTGPGIPDGLKDRLFEKFAQADSSITRRYGGTGLGLAICQSLVNLLGGEIDYESAQGRGTSFRFTIVCPPGLGDALTDGATGLRERVATNEVPALHILVAEDNAINRQVIELMLLRAGHNCDFAHNGLEAVAAVQAADYDIVLMDIQMPEMDGVSATQEIRALGNKFRSLPIVALTANAMKGDREGYIEAGMDDYVPKPIQPADLGAAIFRQTTSAQRLTPATPDIKCPTALDLSEEVDALFRDIDLSN